MKATNYYFILASTQFLVEEEPLEEVLRERSQYYSRTNKTIDFWLLPQPKFLESEGFDLMKSKLAKPCLAIISTNKIFITWLKLRCHNVLSGQFLGPSTTIQHPLDYVESFGK